LISLDAPMKIGLAHFASILQWSYLLHLFPGNSGFANGIQFKNFLRSTKDNFNKDHPPHLKDFFKVKAYKTGSFRGGASPEKASKNGSSLHPKMDLIQPHSLASSDVLEFYGVDEKRGLVEADVTERRTKYGFNSLLEPPRKSTLSLFLEQFEDKLVQILLVVALLSGILSFFEEGDHAFVEPQCILLILVLNAIIGVWQSQSAQDSLDALKRLQPDTVLTLRNGKWIAALPANELVPGDIISLKVGDKVAADSRVLSLKTTTFLTDEASLTGESMSVSKSTDPVSVDSSITSKVNMLFSGTMVTGGSAIAVVTATGMRTEMGKISAGVQEAKLEEEKTPLEQKLDEFGGRLTWIIGGICAVVWAINIPHFDDPVFGSWAKGAIYHAKIAVALGVAAIPEGLPAVITLCLSLGTRRMAKRNVIVRKLPSVETLGCTTIICTDKTGTLTTNQMTCVSLVAPSIKANSKESFDTSDDIPLLNEFEVEGTSYIPSGQIYDFSENSMSCDGWKDLARICSICNDARISYEDGQFIRVGEPTEAALCVLVEKMGVMGIDQSSEPQVAASQSVLHWQCEYDRLATLEFSRDRKSMSVLAKPAGGGKNRLFVKGAPDSLLPRCSKVMLPNGETLQLSQPLRKALEAKVQEMSTRPLRCLALALKEGGDLLDLSDFSKGDDPSSHPTLRNPKNFNDIEDDLTFLGFAGIKDPARPEVSAAIKQCQEAGIRVIVMTGDSRETAIAIARDVNILSKEEDATGKAWIGREFFQLDRATQMALLSSGNLLFCRTEPADKQKLVKMLQEMGEVPAMTGDGVNDAPALQQAAIGIAMGISGTEVAKDAADMVLADDNFATIVNAVEEGRAIYNNMQAFICFLISCNIGEIATIFFATLLGIPEPLTPLHLLWVNLVTDGPPATALGFNPPDPDAMSKPPRARDEPIMNSWLLTRYLVTGFYVGFATIGVFVHWFMEQGVPFNQLMNFKDCAEWSVGMNEVTGEAVSACSVFVEGLAKPQSLALSVLVSMEMLKALSAVSVDNSIFRVPPWKNNWLLLGVFLPSLLHIAVLYVPEAASKLGLMPLTKDDWIYVAKFALPIVLVEEVLKAIGRSVNARKEKKLREDLASKETAKQNI